MAYKLEVKPDARVVVHGLKFREGEGWGSNSTTRCSWDEAVGPNSKYFVDGVMEVVVKISFVSEPWEGYTSWLADEYV